MEKVVHASEDLSLDEARKLKLTCECCVRAKVKCSGPPGPCERCVGWRNLDCVFVEERKRGRPRLPEEQKKAVNKQLRQTNTVDNGTGDVIRPTRTKPRTAQGHQETNSQSGDVICTTTDCWASVVPPNEVVNDSMLVSPSAGLSKEQARVVEIFFALYKNHAAPKSCCKAWFSRQVNKIASMLKAAHSFNALVGLVEWMNRNQIMIAPVTPPERKAFHDADTGHLLPPMTASKGPLLTDLICVKAPPNPEQPTTNGSCACLRLTYDRDERCTVRTSEKFVELFGRDAAFFTSYLDTLYGGILPWGADVFANLIIRPADTLLLVRVLALRFASQPRVVDSNPVRRNVESSHIFQCMRADGSTFDCIVRFCHVEIASFEGCAVEVNASFEPYTGLPPTACDLGAVGSSLPPPLVKNDSTPDPTLEELLLPSALDVNSENNEDRQVYNETWVEDLLRWVDEPGSLDF